MNEITSLPTGALAGLALMMVVQLTLQIWALVVLVRTPYTRIRLGGRKWVWALIIVLGEIVGPIVFFAAGRSPLPAPEAVSTATAEGASAAVDALYGPQGGSQA